MVHGYKTVALYLDDADHPMGARFVHEVWVPSDFVAGAVEPLLPGRVRVVPFPLAEARPEPSALDRAAFGLPPDAVGPDRFYKPSNGDDEKRKLVHHRRIGPITTS